MFEGQVRGQDQTGSLISAADDFKQQFGPWLRGRDIAKLIQDNQMLFFETFEETLELTIVSRQRKWDS